MPTTINGIGTMYYGKSNVHVRPGICSHCQRTTDLKCYETRLWLVFVFIPVIPLGKKQILDDCSLCRWHRAASIGEWQRTSEEAIRDAVQEAEAQPDDPIVALQMIGTFSSFQRHEEASRYGQIVAERFSDNAEVQWGLGAWHDSEGRSAQADSFFRRVLEIEPDHQGAKRALAIGLIGQGELEKARELLSYLDQPDAPPDPQVQSLLAETYHARGEHESALEHYAQLIEVAPQVAKDRKFRKRVRRSEKIAGQEESILPYAFWRPGPILAGFIALVTILLAGFLYNAYSKTHQTVHVINGFHTPINVSIDENVTLTVPPMQRQTVSLAEGDHLAVSRSEGVEFDRFDFRIANTLSQRLFGKSTFVMNPGTMGTLLSETIIYYSGPVRETPNPIHLEFGKSWFVFRGLDYPFAEPPDSISMDAEKKSVSKKCLSFYAATPSVILGSLPDSYPAGRQLDFIEHHLSLNPDDMYLVLWYSNVGMRDPATLRRTRDFLHQGLDRRPLSVQWHREYQVLTTLDGDADSLVPLYDRMLGETPENSSLLYLRGCLASHTSEAIAYCDRALDADPENAYASGGKAHHLCSQGKFDGAKKILEQTRHLDPMLNDTLYFSIRFSLEEYEALETELRETLRQSPLSITDRRYLMTVLFAQNKVTEARQVHQDYLHHVRKQHPSYLHQFERISRMTLAYLEDDLETFQQNARRLNATESSVETFAALVELGDPKQAELFFDEGSGILIQLTSGSKALLLSLAWAEKGDQEKADQWHQTAIDHFSRGNPGEKQIAALLQSGKTLTLDEVDDSSADIDVKATVLIALARKNDRHREALLSRARKLIVPSFFPNRFLERMLEASSSP